MLASHLQNVKLQRANFKHLWRSNSHASRSLALFGRARSLQFSSTPIQTSRSLVSAFKHRQHLYHNRDYQTHSCSVSKISLYTRNTEFSWLNAILAAAGVSGAIVTWDLAHAEDYMYSEEPMLLNPDPWEITGETKPDIPQLTVRTLVMDILRGLWHLFKQYTGISFLEQLFTVIFASFRHLKRVLVPNWLWKLGRVAGQISLLNQPLNPFDMAGQISSVLSKTFTISKSSFGALEPLELEVIKTAQDSYRGFDDHNDPRREYWLYPHFSTPTYEEVLLSPQYFRFLARAKSDGSIQCVEGYFSMTGDFVPVPMLVFYTQVSRSLEDFRAGKWLDKWISQLKYPKPVGVNADITQDLSDVYRATFLTQDLSRLIASEDWKKYTGSSLDNTSLIKVRSSNAGKFMWKIAGSSSEVSVNMDNEPKAPYARLDVILPETSESLERHISAYPLTLMCARLCNYLENHDVARSILGTDLRVTQSPMVRESYTGGADYRGTVLECWFTCTGTQSSAELHFQFCSDPRQNGTQAVAPILSIWAFTDAGRVTLYRNKRNRYRYMHYRPKSVPVPVQSEDSPYMISDFVAVEKDRPK